MTASGATLDLRAGDAVLQAAVDQGTVPTAVASVWHAGSEAHRFAAGGFIADGHTIPVTPDTSFLVASLTKPVVCAGAMLLLQAGHLSLEQPIAALLKGFGKRGKDRITVRHLMTHTSGLPDQLPQNEELRQRHAPLEDFVQAVFALEPLFPAGTRISYQSMGILSLAEIIQRLTGRPLREYLRDELFLPLGMEHTTLGLPAGEAPLVPVWPAGESSPSEATDWDWNSTYWRDLGSPWGGLHSTASDLGRFLAHMLGDLPGPLSAAACRAMVTDQTSGMPGMAAEDAQRFRWGLGWALGLNQFGDLTSPRTFGHTGATGTVFWADPETHLACVLLTNKPGRNDHLFPRYANTVASALP